ncbi:hypothetical protein C8R44DRAFT_147345 [Mycena epipterygia]|nr:hypothetical protein C8R44DRAFT_147345 [Mycena epipterygia]
MKPASIVKTFPQELFDQVIDETKADVPTLRSCALVCRDFLPRSQAHIFSNIDLILTEATQPERFHRLYGVISQAPRLVRYIKGLRITSNSILLRNIVWATLDVLIPVLQHLPELRSFTLEACWGNLPSRFRSAICDLCRLSKLSKLRLIRLGDVPLHDFSQLVTSPALTDLSLWDIDFVLVAHNGFMTNTNLRLTHLSLNTDSRSFLNIIVPWLAQGANLSQLQSFCTWCATRTNLDTQMIMDSAKRSLEHLSLVQWSGPIDLSLHNMTSLRSIRLYVDPGSHGGSPVPMIVELLKSHCTPSTLTAIKIDINIWVAANPPGSIVDSDWDSLSAVLSAARFPALKTFELVLDQTYSQGFFAATKAHFSRLESEGIFKCTTE